MSESTANIYYSCSVFAVVVYILRLFLAPGTPLCSMCSDVVVGAGNTLALRRCVFGLKRHLAPWFFRFLVPRQSAGVQKSHSCTGSQGMQSGATPRNRCPVPSVPRFGTHQSSGVMHRSGYVKFSPRVVSWVPPHHVEVQEFSVSSRGRVVFAQLHSGMRSCALFPASTTMSKHGEDRGMPGARNNRKYMYYFVMN